MVKDFKLSDTSISMTSNVAYLLEMEEQTLTITGKNFHEEMENYFKKNNLPSSTLIFPTIYGNYMCDRNERATLKKRLSALGLPDYGFHLFRHTHASMMLNSGTNWKELQHRMGHKSITTTMDTYAELAPKKKFEAVEIFQNKMDELKT